MLLGLPRGLEGAHGATRELVGLEPDLGVRTDRLTELQCRQGVLAEAQIRDTQVDVRARQLGRSGEGRQPARSPIQGQQRRLEVAVPDLSDTLRQLGHVSVLDERRRASHDVEAKDGAREEAAGSHWH